MTRGFQPDDLAEHAHLIELAALVKRWQDAESDTLTFCRNAINTGTRARTIALALDMSKPTLYRWLREAHKSEETASTDS